MARAKSPVFLPKAGEIYLTYNEYRSGGEPDDPSDRWTSHADEIIEFHPTGLFTQKCSFQETLSVPFVPSEHVDKPIYVVVVRYYDGSTFGRICGLWKVVGAFTDNDGVKAALKAVNEGKNSQEVAERIAPFVCEDYFGAWFGYFSGFEGVEVHELTLKAVNPLSDDDDGDNPKQSVKWIKH